MKPRPPTMRDKRRYILLRYVPFYTEIEPRRLYHGIVEAATALFGDAAASQMQISVISSDNGYAVIRCRRGDEMNVMIALATVTAVNGCRFALHTVAVSGTLHALRKRIRKPPVPEDAGQDEIAGKLYRVLAYSGQKTDLIEKGIKIQETLYFTQRDREEF